MGQFCESNARVCEWKTIKKQRAPGDPRECFTFPSRYVIRHVARNRHFTRRGLRLRNEYAPRSTVRTYVRPFNRVMRFLFGNDSDRYRTPLFVLFVADKLEIVRRLFHQDCGMRVPFFSSGKTRRGNPAYSPERIKAVTSPIKGYEGSFELMNFIRNVWILCRIIFFPRDREDN